MIINNFYKNKKILVTGGTGLIGRQLVDILISYGSKVSVVSLDSPKNLDKKVKFIKSDLRIFSNCLKVCKGIDLVFHLAGVKGSPDMTLRKPASFMIPTLLFSINMMEAARLAKVSNYLFTSSVGVYAPADIFFEGSIGKTLLLFLSIYKTI